MKQDETLNWNAPKSPAKAPYSAETDMPATYLAVIGKNLSLSV